MLPLPSMIALGKWVNPSEPQYLFFPLFNYDKIHMKVTILLVKCTPPIILSTFLLWCKHHHHLSPKLFFYLFFDHAVLSCFSCIQFCNPMDCSPPGFSVHGIFQARVMACVASTFSGALHDPGIEPGSPALQVDSLPSEPAGKHLYIRWET